MSLSQRVRDALTDTPLTTAEVAEKLGETRNVVSTNLSVQYHTQGLVDRVEVGRSASNQPRYGYIRRIDAPKKKPPPKTSDDVKQISYGVKQKVEHASASSLESVVTSFASDFAKQVAAIISRTLQTTLESEIKKALPAALPKLPASKEPVFAGEGASITHPAFPDVKGYTYTSDSAKPLHSVVIVGLKNGNAAFLTDEFKDALAITSYDPDVNLHTLKSKAIHANAVFVMVGFVSHKVSEALKSVGANVRTVHGGMSSIREALTSYYVKEAS